MTRPLFFLYGRLGSPVPLGEVQHTLSIQKRRCGTSRVASLAVNGVEVYFLLDSWRYGTSPFGSLVGHLGSLVGHGPVQQALSIQQRQHRAWHINSRGLHSQRSSSVVWVDGVGKKWLFSCLCSFDCVVLLLQ